MKLKTEKKNIRYNVYIWTFFITFFILVSAFYLADIYPFGDRTLLIWDSRWQYVQFFTWLKKVLIGDGNIFYSFNSGMGSNMLGLFAYYLASPFNLLIIFFNDIQMFIFVITILKLSIAAVTCSFFIKKRFPEISPVWIVLLSIGYGTMSYAISQKCNLMWLDGMILLPLIAYGVYHLIDKRKKGYLFASVLILIISNWYMAYMCCLFSILYFFYELVIKEDVSNSNKKEVLRKNICMTASYGMTMLLSVMSSMVLFLPTILNLLQGKGIENTTPYNMEFHIDLKTFLIGLLPGVWRNKEFGTESQGIMIFCGSLVIFCVLAYFFTEKKTIKEKVMSGMLLFILIFSATFIPLENIWNGFRRANSYYCRFSYIISFFMIYIAASYLVRAHKLFNINTFRLVIGILVIVELIFNSYMITRSFAPLEAREFNEYNKIQSKQFKLLKSYDKNFYRTEQASIYGKNRGSNYLGVFNEGLVYGYKGFASYTSTINTDLTTIYNKCGYHDYYRFMQYNEPILASDSVWGIKYILSEHEIKGCKEVSSVAVNNGKEIYQNPYALSIGFGVNDSNIDGIIADNPFEYQNKLLSQIAGYPVHCYIKADAVRCETKKGVKFVVNNAGKNRILYGYITNVQKNNEKDYVYINGKVRTDYSRVTSYKIFQIEDGEKDKSAIIKIKGNMPNKNEIGGTFYYLDLEEFSKIIKSIKRNEFQVQKAGEGYIEGNYKADEKATLMLTIPYDKGWKIKCNGQEIKADEDQTFITLKLNKVNNHIEMRYISPGFFEGTILSLIAVLIFAVWQRFEKNVQLELNK